MAASAEEHAQHALQVMSQALLLGEEVPRELMDHLMSFSKNPIF